MYEKRPADSRSRFATLAIVLCLVAGAAAGVFVYTLTEQVPPPPVQTLSAPKLEVIAAGTKRPMFTLRNLAGEQQSISAWDGKLIVLNFWATWCGPCLHEIPLFVELQSKYADRGLQFVGIAIDTPANVEPFYRELGMNYPTMLGQADAIRVGEQYGNTIGGLPYTVFIDREGYITQVKNGPLERDELEAALAKLL